MNERQGPFWVYGSGRLRLAVSAIARTPAALWVDGALVERTLVAERATLQAELAGDGWHAVVLEVPELLDASPPQGLELIAVAFAR
jgi:hypothetical protein